MVGQRVEGDARDAQRGEVREAVGQPREPVVVQAQLLRRISKNKLRYGLRVWPDEEGAQCPSLP